MDLDAIRKRLQGLQAKTTGSQYKWKPEAGETVVRIVPYQHAKLETPFLELYFHYNLGKRPYLSPHTFGEADPVLEFSEKLKSTGDKEDWIISKKLEPTLRTFAPIIVRGKEKEGVKFWGFGKEIYSELLKICLDPDYGDIIDLTKGRDVVVTYKTPAEAGNQYGKVSIRVKPNQSIATDDKEVADLIMNEQPNIYDVFPKSTYEELKEAIQRWMNPESSEENDEDIVKARQAASREGYSSSSDGDTGDPPNEPDSNEPAKSETSPDEINSQFEKLFAKK